MFKALLLHRDVQLIRLNQINSDYANLNKLYLQLIKKSKEKPKKNLSINEIKSELIRLKTC